MARRGGNPRSDQPGPDPRGKGKPTRPTPSEPGEPAPGLRIVGGTFRGRKLKHHGDAEVTRPMKHRVREAIFNLVGTQAAGMHALDLFAGTGALGLEALSRGAVWATFIERHVPTAGVVRDNMASLGVTDRCDLLVTSAFVWCKRDLPQPMGGWSGGPPGAPWLAFVSPPYQLYIDDPTAMLSMVEALQRHAPPGSMLVVESDARFDPTTLPTPNNSAWDIREYPPAVVAVWRQ